MNHEDFIREYFNIIILEKIQKLDEVASSFQQRLKTSNLKIHNDDEATTKQLVDEAINKLILNETNKNLSLPEVRATIIDRAFDSINPVVRDNFNKIVTQNLNQKSSRHIQEDISQKLILSEIFMFEDGQTGFLEKSRIPKKVEDEKLQNSVLMTTGSGQKYSIDDFEKDIENLKFNKMNCKKAFLLFDVLNKYNFKINFDSEKLDCFEGHLLKLIYADNQNFNYFILKKNFFFFMQNFVEHFQIDFEARIDSDKMISSPHLVMLASYSPILCQHLDKLDFVEKFLEKLPTLDELEHHLFLRIFINLFRNKSQMVQKLVNLKIFEKVLEEILKSNSQSNIALFSILMSRASQEHLNTKQFISKDLLKKMYLKINENFVVFEDLKNISLKNKNKPSEFKHNSSTDAVVLLDQYCRNYSDLIRQKTTITNFKHLYYTALGFLKFISKFTSKLEDEQKLEYFKLIVDLLSVFYYQSNILDAALISFKKFLCPFTLEFFLEEFFETNLVNNFFTVFERNDFSRKNIRVLSHFQGLLLSLIEVCQLNGKILKIRQIKKLLDRLYKIRQLISGFYYNLKARYLAKGLLKYVSKLKKHLMKEVIFPLDEILSQNALILQKLSHTQVLDENMLFYANKNTSVSFEKQSEELKIAQIIENGNQLLYIVSKVDRKDNYLEEVITFNLYILEKLEAFISEAETNKQNYDFDFIESIIEFLIINIYFVKTYDENYKKATSIKVLKRTVELFVRILHFAKSFVNLQSNYQIYILLENLGLFWLLFFDFNYRFYDRLSFVFIDNLKTLSRQNNDNKNESFSSETLYKILIFLNEFVDLKSKNALLNFIIIKQLDTICLTLTNISNLNQNFIVNIFQKVFNSNYGTDIHKFQQKYFLSLSVKVLSIEGVKESFLEFVCKNMLYLNKYVSSILRNLLDKNFEINQLKKLTVQEKSLFNHTVLEEPLSSSIETTQYLLQLIQLNIRNKTLFEDLVMILRTQLKTASSVQNGEIIKKIFLSESIFRKLVRLYKKDQLNLSKILKYLLLICKHFNFLNEVNIPQGVIRSILVNKEINKFNDVYMLLLTYIFKNDLFKEFQEDINSFFNHTKNALDELLYFGKQVNLDSNLRMIYYSLKVFKNCSSFVKGIPAMANLDTDEFIVRYVLQIMDDNNRLEIVPVNNLYHHFKKRENILANFKTSIYESKIVNLIFSIYKKNNDLFILQTEDFFVVNKLISFAYVVINQKNYNELIPMMTTLLQKGIKEENKDLFKDIYYDFYLLLNYDFNYTDESLSTLVKDYIYEKRKSVVASLTRLLDEVKRKNIRFDTMGFNSVIRTLLKIFYIINDSGKDLFIEHYRQILGALDFLLENNYKDIHSLTKLEKLFVNIYLLIHNQTGLNSVNSSRVFLWLFNTHVEFKISSLVDKYIYMGLFNNYLKNMKLEKYLKLDQNSGEIDYIVKEESQVQITKWAARLSYDTKKVIEAFEQLNYKGLLLESELILMKFSTNLFKIDRKKFFEVNVKSDVIVGKIRAIKAQMVDIFSKSESDLLLLKYRIKFVLVFLKKENLSDKNDETVILNEFMTVIPLIESHFADDQLLTSIKKENFFKYIQLELKVIKYLYKSATIKNEAFLKPLLLQTLFNIWKKVIDFPENELTFKTSIKHTILRITMRIMKNRYDEMRFALYRDFLPSIFEQFNYFKALEQSELEQEKKIEKVDEPPVENPVNVNNVANTSEAKLESIIQDPQNQFVQKLIESDYDMVKDFSQTSVLETTLYLFYLVSKNNLLMSMEFKLSIFEILKKQKQNLFHTKLCEILYESIKLFYLSDEKSQIDVQNAETKSPNPEKELTDVEKLLEPKSLPGPKEMDDKKKVIQQEITKANNQEKEKQKDTIQQIRPKVNLEALTVENASIRLKESSLAYKQKNILYVHKVLTTLNATIEKNNKLSEKEENYLTFGLVSLHKHLLENLDPELFNAFGFFGLLSAFIVDDRIGVTFKKDCLGILKLFLKTCQHKNSVKPSETTLLVTFYERLLFDNYPEIVQSYFEVLDLIFKYIIFSEEFINEYMDKMSYCLFEAYKSISEIVFVSALSVFVKMLQTLKPKVDGQRISNAVYFFLKINNKEMKVYERTLFVVMLAYFEENNLLDSVKLANATFFVKYFHTMEGLKRIPQSLECLIQLTETYDNFQKLLKSINFEVLYKLVLKHYVNDTPVLRTVSKLFLRYSYKIEENKFEMFDCLKQIIKYIRFFYHKKDDPNSKEMVILFYKSLVNASLFKTNSDYLVKSDLNKIVSECSYLNSNECSVVIISLLFNICYIFEKDEFKINKFITSNTIDTLSAIFEESLESRNDSTICELIDLFVGFIQHQFIDFFNESTISKIKLTLNLYYNSMEITMKFLNILRDISVSGTNEAKQLVFNEFDYIFLYHIHYRNIKNAKINTLTKHIIYNLLIFRETVAKEQELVTYGVPENIIHTFSLKDSEPVLILNLRIILLSLKFEKCSYFIKNNFLAVIREIIFSKPDIYKDEIIFFCVEILRLLLNQYKDPQFLNCYYYFNNVSKLFDLLGICSENEDYMIVVLKILKNLIDNDKENIASISQSNKQFLNQLINLKSKNKNRDLMNLVFNISNFVDIHESILESKMDKNRHTQLSMDDRTVLENGQSVLVFLRDIIHKNSWIKFNFVKNKFKITNIELNSSQKKNEKKYFSFTTNRIESINKSTDEQNYLIESYFKSYFQRNLRKELYFSISIGENEEKEELRETVFLIFENEYKCQKWRSLIDVLRNK